METFITVGLLLPIAIIMWGMIIAVAIEVSNKYRKR